MSCDIQSLIFRSWRISFAQKNYIQQNCLFFRECMVKKNIHFSEYINYHGSLVLGYDSEPRPLLPYYSLTRMFQKTRSILFFRGVNISCGMYKKIGVKYFLWKKKYLTTPRTKKPQKRALWQYLKLILPACSLICP